MGFWERVLAGKIAVRRAEIPALRSPPARAHKKRHGVNKERSRADASKARRMAERRAEAAANRKVFLAEARRYWRGDRPDHP